MGHRIICRSRIDRERGTPSELTPVLPSCPSLLMPTQCLLLMSSCLSSGSRTGGGEDVWCYFPIAYFRNRHHIPRCPALASDVGRFCLVIGWLTIGSPHHPDSSLSLPLATTPFFTSPVLSQPPSPLLPTHPAPFSHFISLSMSSPSSPPTDYFHSIPLFSLHLCLPTSSHSFFTLPPTPLSCEI